MGRRLLIASALALALAAPGSAAADGLPGGGDADPGGVSLPTLDANYVVVPAGRGTVVGRIDKESGRLRASSYLARRFSMPTVALDATPGGLSADGRTLVLIRPRKRFPQKSTTLVVLDGEWLRVRKNLRLRGDFSYDALSPDGRSLYLIQYTGRSDPSRYAVRRYDVRRERLLPGRIVDQREPDEDMSGYPITRATSAHGRWAYTLYDGTHHPFVHALDTVHRRAFCIDLDGLGKDDLFDMRLALVDAGRTLTVSNGRGRRLNVDTRTFRVWAPSPRPPAPAKSGNEDDGSAWLVIEIGGAALLVAGGALAAVARRRRRMLAGA